MPRSKKSTALFRSRFEHSYVVWPQRLCQQTKSLQETRVSFSAAGFSGFFNFFASNLTCEISAPMGARHKIFGPTCSVASPPTNDTFSFLKKLRGDRETSWIGGIPKKIDFCQKQIDKVFYFALFFLTWAAKLFRIHFCTEQNKNFWNRPKECWDIRNLVRVGSNRKFRKS